MSNIAQNYFSNLLKNTNETCINVKQKQKIKS